MKTYNEVNMKLKDYIIDLLQYDLDTEIYYGGSCDINFEPNIESTEDCDTGEYYYRIVGK